MGKDAVLTKLISLVAHIGGKAVEDDVAVIRLAPDGEFLPLSVDEGCALAVLTAEVLGDEATLGYHQGDSAVGDKSTAEVSRLWQGKLGRENQVAKPHFLIGGGSLAVGQV